MSEYFLVDYDLPAEPLSRRSSFYAARKRLFKRAVKTDAGLAIVHSTQSVIITSNAWLASELSLLAKLYDARATHVYRLGDVSVESAFENPAAEPSTPKTSTHTEPTLDAYTIKT
jgi:hypothetical protein